MKRAVPPLLLILLILPFLATAARGEGVGIPVETLAINPIGSYDHGDEGTAEIVDFDPVTQRLFVVNAVEATIDVLDASNPAAPAFAFAMDVTAYGAVANSVHVREGVVAVAVENADKTLPGQAVFYDTDGTFLSAVTVGTLPDMVTISPDGNWALVANEGEPNDAYTTDPEGSVSLIDLSGGAASLVQGDVTTVGFADFNVGGPRHGELPAGVRIFGPGATVAQDLEPEYIAVSPDSSTAWVTLQENNAVAVINLAGQSVTAIKALGTKDHTLVPNAFDPSDRDSGYHIGTWPVRGLYLPDGISTLSVGGTTYLVTGNEGDSRDYDGFGEEARVKDLDLDPTAFPNATALQDDSWIGRLKTTTTLGDTDGDGDYDELYSYGGRSFAIWTADGTLLYDSGDNLELITGALVPDFFNSNGDAGSFDTRSDDKGPEPENVTTGEVAGTPYIFVGLERTGGVVVFDVSDPAQPTFAAYPDNRDDAGNPQVGGGDLGPEGVLFVPGNESPTGNPLLVTANEISGTTTIYEIPVVPTAVAVGRMEASSGSPLVMAVTGLLAAALVAGLIKRRR